jgi:tetratricopeptide (TPR) repeat protein
MSRQRHPARADVARGISSWERDDFESALETFQGILEEYPFADVHNKAGLCLAMMGRMEESLAYFDAAIELNSSYAEAHLNRGIVLNELGRTDEARAAVSTAQEIDCREPRGFPSEVGNRLAVTHAQLGDLYLVANHAEDAAMHYEAALAIRPGFMDIRSKFAEALIEMGELDQARRELESILHNRPGFVGARVRLGVVYHRLGHDGAAVREWMRCSTEDPEDMRPRAYMCSVGAKAPPGDADQG